MGDVQDRYVGDLGDFLTFGLLRWLVPPDPPAPLRLGVVWYLTADESHNADGKHVGYLNAEHAAAERLRGLDPDLYERLAAIVGSGRRSTAAVAEAEVLGRGACFFQQVLDLADLPIAAREARRERRCSWVARALAATASCDVIFVDPDNGIRSTLHRVPRHRTKSVKHAYLDEVGAFAQRGQSVVAYHHADRSAPVEQQALRRLNDLAGEVPVQPVAAVRASRGTTRLFLVGAASTAHADYLSDRLAELEQSRWAAELSVYWARSGRFP